MGVDEMIFVIVEVLVVMGFTKLQNRGSNIQTEEYMNIVDGKSWGIS